MCLTQHQYAIGSKALPPLVFESKTFSQKNGRRVPSSVGSYIASCNWKEEFM